MLSFIINYYIILLSYEGQKNGDDCKLQCVSEGGRLPGHDEIQDFSKIDFNQTGANLNTKNIHESPGFRFFVNAEYSFLNRKWFWRQNGRVFTNEKWTEFVDRANPDLRDILRYNIHLPSETWTAFPGGWNTTNTFSSNYWYLNDSIGYYSCSNYPDTVLKVLNYQKAITGV